MKPSSLASSTPNLSNSDIELTTSPQSNILRSSNSSDNSLDTSAISLEEVKTSNPDAARHSHSQRHGLERGQLKRTPRISTTTSSENLPNTPQKAASSLTILDTPDLVVEVGTSPIKRHHRNSISISKGTNFLNPKDPDNLRTVTTKGQTIKIGKAGGVEIEGLGTVINNTAGKGFMLETPRNKTLKPLLGDSVNIFFGGDVKAREQDEIPSSRLSPSSAKEAKKTTGCLPCVLL